jgi:hypothetical protein
LSQILKNRGGLELTTGKGTFYSRMELDVGCVTVARWHHAILSLM